MLVSRTIVDCRAQRAGLKKVAFVPTMGALHAGHVSLIEIAKKRAKQVIVSIFVNPTQFGPHEDLSKYPRPIEDDLRKCEEAGVAMVFNPSVDEMYPPGQPQIVVDLPQLSEGMEGKHRPGHFRGVCQVVAKLFHVVEPQFACFGMKDFQQLRIIESMVEALNWTIDIVRCPTMREKDGLAMSSRNQYLSADERQRALAINRGLNMARDEVAKGVRQTNRLTALMQNVLLDPGKLGRIPVSIEYVAAVDPITLKSVELVTGPTLLATAARVGTTRLIDNLIVTPEG